MSMVQPREIQIPNMVRDFMQSEQHCHDGVGHVDSFRAFDRLLAADNQQVDFIDFVRVPHGSSIGRHRHGNNTEWYVIMSGSGVMWFNNHETSVGPWDVLVNEPYQEHGLVNKSGKDIIIVVFQLSDTDA
ncbi:MAG: cupin domain-containing protein [Acidiferrobacterales bacterium]|nr:cupin domain-containing protein [Acidiferrobacterales bacterium]